MRSATFGSTLILLIVGATPARAALGEDADSVRSDLAALNGTLATSGAPDYTVHQIATPGGTEVREYLSTTGTVFAVRWRGRTSPDLRLLLGRYYARFAEAALRPHASHHQFVLETSELSLRIVKAPRVLVGIAYLPQALPAGVSVRALE